MLDNIQWKYQLDSIQRQALAKEVGAHYGSLAFLYAKHVYQGLRSLDSLHPSQKEAVPKILAYVKENGYNQIFE